MTPAEPEGQRDRAGDVDRHYRELHGEMIPVGPDLSHRIKAATWDLAWCWPCKQRDPLAPVHEETECPYLDEESADV